MITTDKKEFAACMEELIGWIESGKVALHSVKCGPCACQVLEKGDTEFKNFYSLEYRIRVRTHREI